MVREDLELWRMAKLMIDRYGDAAGPKSAVFARARCVSDDADGVRMWLGIANAISELQRCRRSDEALN